MKFTEDFEDWMIRNWFYVDLLFIMVILAFIASVALLHFEAVGKERNLYCYNVEAGVWADYKHIYEKECMK